MKASITTISVATVLFLMAGKASGSGEISCLVIAQGICENYIQLLYNA